MLKLFQFTREYLFPRSDAGPARPLVEGDHGLDVTGSHLVRDLLDAIRLRRSVLVSGPRGCGKTWCVKSAIGEAFDQRLIGGWHFVQGNREIPRDYLSEDMLVINRQGQPELLDALTIRAPKVSRPSDRQQTMRAGAYRSWPAIPAVQLHELRREHKDPFWIPWDEPTDWTVLFLDEINRFGDGFLDSLLSLTEEGIIVRNGEQFHVPVVVMATANPPGYDVTAKKLSPPLQARIGRSYRLSQPPLDQLVHVILPSKEEMFGKTLGQSVALSDQLKYLASAATLCLWGDPDAGVRGASFLTAGTRELLRQAMTRDVIVSRAMSDLSTLIQFGPDARAVGEWLGAAASLAKAGAIDENALIATAGHVLGHKLRESFNEGSEPEKVAALQRCIRDIVSRVLTKPVYRELFVLPYDAAAKRLQINQRALFDLLLVLGPEPRWHAWLRALAELPTDLNAVSFAAWRRAQSKGRSPGAFTKKGEFLNHEECRWFEQVLLAGLPPEVRAPLLTAEARAGIDLESSLRHRLSQKSYASQFTESLVSLASSTDNRKLLDADRDGATQHLWVELLDALIDPHGGEPATRIQGALQLASRTTGDEELFKAMLVASLRTVNDEAGSHQWRDRAEAALRVLLPADS